MKLVLLLRFCQYIEITKQTPIHRYSNPPFLWIILTATVNNSFHFDLWLTSIIVELYQIRSSFYQGNFQNVVNEPISSLTRSHEAQLYQYRSRIELGQSAQVATEMGETESTGAGFDVVRAYAEYRSGQKEKAVEDISELIQADVDDGTVQVIGGTVLYLEGRIDEALELLSNHENNLEA